MEAASTTTKRNFATDLRQFLGTRRGSFLVAVVAAGLAAVALVAYLNDYKNDVRGGTVPTQVLIADRLIPEGTAGDVIATDRLFKPSTVAQDQASSSALVDASALAGTVAVRDIYPGEQLTAADFQTGGDPLRGRLTGTQRAVAIPMDAAHGLLGTVRAGDRVDVFGNFTGAGAGNRGVLKTIAQGVLVLRTPPTSGTAAEASSSSAPPGSVVLRLTDQQAAKLAYVADSGRIWLALRPPVGGQESEPATVTQGSLLGSSSRDTSAGPGR